MDSRKQHLRERSFVNTVPGLQLRKKYALHNSFQHKKSKNLAFVVILGKHTGALLVFSYCRSITVSCASGFCLSSLCQLCVMPNMLQLQSSKNCPVHLLHINFLWCKHFDVWLTVHCLFKDCQFCPHVKWWQSSLRGAFTGALVHLHLLLKVLSQKQSRSTSTLLTTVQVSHWNIPFIVQLIVVEASREKWAFQEDPTLCCFLFNVAL